MFMLLSPTANAWLVRRGLPLLLGLNLLLLLFYLVFDYQLTFHSDAAVKNLLAQEIRETGRYIPPDWYFVNRDLWLFNTHTVIVPLLGLLPNGYAVHALSDLLSAILILGAGWLFTGLLEVSRSARLGGLLLLSAGLSPIMAEHIFGQAAYGTAYYSGVFLLYCYWRQLHASGRAYWRWSAACATLAVLLCWSNPQRALIFYGLPLLGAALALKLAELHQLQQAPTVRRLPHWRTAGLLLLALATGGVLYCLSLYHTNVGEGLTNIGWQDLKGMVHNLLSTLQGLLMLFDSVPNPNSKVVSLCGAYQILRLLAGLALLYLLPLALLRLLSPRHPGRLFCATFAACALALNLILMLTTTVADMSSPDGSVRYLVPTLISMLLLLAAVAIDGLGLRPVQRVVGVAAVLILGTSSLTTYFWPYHLHFRTPPAWRLPTPATELADYLASQGLRYGYSNFWHAGKLTVLSKQQVRVRQVFMQQGLPTPMRGLSSARWYRPDYYQGESFLLLHETELPQFDPARMARHMGAPARVLRYGDWHIFVYPQNLAVLPGWDDRFLQPQAWPATAETPHQVGQPTAEGLQAEAGASGMLYYGPFAYARSGRYLVHFEIEAEGAPDGHYGMVDVTSQNGAQVHARQDIRQSGRHRITLPLELRHGRSNLEFRVQSNGHGRLLVRRTELVSAAQD